jgi:CRP/FNR family cyclic AMP-dependent transcriptional regulator
MLSKSGSGASDTTADKRAILRANPLFANLPTAVTDQLASYAITQNVKRGATIFRKGDPGISLYAVCAGTVKISVPSADGKDAVFNLIGAGSVFGEIALLDGGQRTADAVAAVNCELMKIERRNFMPLLREHPDVATKIIEVLCARLRNSSEQIEDVIFLDLPGRLAKTLLRLSETNGDKVKRTKITITQKEIGQIIGMSRESTNRQLRQWSERKWIKLEQGSVIVVEPAALASLFAGNGR